MVDLNGCRTKRRFLKYINVHEPIFRFLLGIYCSDGRCSWMKSVINERIYGVFGLQLHVFANHKQELCESQIVRHCEFIFGKWVLLMELFAALHYDWYTRRMLRNDSFSRNFSVG